MASVRSRVGENMKRIKSTPGMVVFTSKKHHVRFLARLRRKKNGRLEGAMRNEIYA